MNQHRFVIILPTYERPDFLIRALNSIKNQSYSHWQCVIIDDGSTDNTNTITREYKDSEAKFHCITQSNQGVNSARNTGIEYALAHFNDFYFIFIDDDDYLHRDCLSKANACITTNHEYKWHGFNCNKASNDKKISRIKKYGPNNYIRDLMFSKNWRGDITSFIHNSIVDKYRYSTEIKNGEEWFFWSQLAIHNDTFITDFPGSYKDYLPEGLTKSGFNRDKAIQVIKLKVNILSPIVGEKKLVHQLVSLAKNLYQQGFKDEAKKILIKVFKLKPWYFRQYPHWIKQLFY
jgi:hypothetical protein